MFSVQITADLNTCQVEAVQLGANSSALDGIEMIRNKVYQMSPNSVLHVLTGCFPQKLNAVQIPNNTSDKDRRTSESGVEKSSTKGDTKEKSRHKSSDSSHNHNRKKRSLSSEENGVPFKKPKLLHDSSSSKSKTTDHSKDDQHLKDVSAKLELMKANAKKTKTPEPTSSGIKSPSTKSDQCSPTPEKQQGWRQHDSLYVFTSSNVKSSKKVIQTCCCNSFPPPIFYAGHVF